MKELEVVAIDVAGNFGTGPLPALEPAESGGFLLKGTVGPPSIHALCAAKLCGQLGVRLFVTEP